MITDVNGQSGPSVSIDLESVLTEGNTATLPIITSSYMENYGITVNNSNGGQNRIIGTTPNSVITKLPLADGRLLTDQSLFRAEQLRYTLLVSANTTEVLDAGMDAIFTGTSAATWSIQSPVGLVNQVTKVSNVSASSTLTVDVVGAAAEIFSAGAAVTSITIAPGKTIVFKNDGTYAYACA